MSAPTPVPRPRSSRVPTPGSSRRPRQSQPPKRPVQQGSPSPSQNDEKDGARERGAREYLSQNKKQEKYFFGYWQEVAWLVAWTLLGLLLPLSIWLIWLIR